MSREELLDARGLMRREIVGDDVDLLAPRRGDQLGEESHKLLAGVTRGRLAQHLTVSVLSAAYSDRVPWR